MIRIATRRSPLALWQAEHVAARLRSAHPGIEIELLPMVSAGDQLLDVPLARVGGKGLFVKELELALLDGRADLAVHSMKDVPAHFPAGLGLATMLRREDPRDALVGSRSVDELPVGGRLGTASQRRQLQLLERRPDLRVSLLRGNVNTRLAKLDAGEFDAIMLAAAGLRRLNLAQRIDGLLEPEVSLPAIGQGALGIECRLDDTATQACVAVLHDPDTALCLGAERALGARLEGNCQLPVAGFAQLEGDSLRLRGLVGLPDGSRVLRDEIRGPASEAAALGDALGRRLLAAGGADILAQLVGHAH